MSDPLDLPPAPAPVGAYERGMLHRGLGLLSGQLPFVEGRLAFTGRVGAELTPVEGREAAAITARNVVAQVKAVLDGRLDRLETLLRVECYVACAPDFVGIPAVLDGASETLVALLGPRGRHARTAIPVPRLPLDSPIELVVSFAASE